MNSILCDQNYEIILIYLKDILINSDSSADDLPHLQIMPTPLKEHKLDVSSNKYKLMKRQTAFLGLRVVTDGVSISDDRKSA